jgi:adenosylhomocysteine nucleosidase
LQDTERPIGIVVAVEEELRAILKRMSPAVVDSANGIDLNSGLMGGKPVVVLKSGMGITRTRTATIQLLDRARPRALIIAGFCAATLSKIRIGDVMLIEEVYAATGPANTLEHPHVVLRPDPGLIAAAERMDWPPKHVLEKMDGPYCVSVELLTWDRIASTVDAKRLIHDRLGGPLIDLETAGAADIAGLEGIPWIAFRAVTDGAYDNLPLDFSRFVDEKGEVLRNKVALAMLSRPWKIPAMIRLGARSSLAARNLALCVEAFLGALPG